MTIIDIRTVMLIYVITNALCAIVMTSLWLQNRKRFPAISLWLIDFVFQFIAVLLVLLRGIVPDFFSIIFANTLVIVGTVILYIGLELFVGKTRGRGHNYVMVSLFVFLHAYFTYIYPDLRLRNINLSLGLFYICVQAAWLMLRRVEPEMREVTRATGIVFLIFSLASLVRIVMILAHITESQYAVTDFFKTGLSDTLVLVTYMVLFIALTFALFNLINRRLSEILEKELIEREKAENSLRESEEKYRSILENILEGYFESDLKGNIVFANDSACRMLGYDKECLYKINYRQFSTPATKKKLQDIYREVFRTGIPSKINDYEIIRGDGAIRINELSVALIRDSEGKATGFRSVARDITEKKHAEELIRLRLSLLEFAATHTLEELLQKTLDEVEIIVNSSISFYHFVEKDQKTISLQAWSSRTMKEFCKAEGKGMHYNIDQAGVWVDCLHEKRPVIHNDYHSLSHRKGLPEGHAEVIRELVVPIMREGTIVAILGVGNKPSDYNEEDIETVSYLADVAWEITERKRAEEQIKHMASHDSLTDLPSLRLAKDRLAMAIGLAQRHKKTIAVMFIDLDDFKNVNDTLGHDAGDFLLKTVAQRFISCIRKTDTIARVGGDEFLLIVTEIVSLNDAENIAKKILKIVSQPIIIEGQKVRVSASVGIAFYPNNSENIDELIKLADQAMYCVKSGGKNGFVFSKQK